jgi:hypothetical protein
VLCGAGFSRKLEVKLNRLNSLVPVICRSSKKKSNRHRSLQSCIIDTESTSLNSDRVLLLIIKISLRSLKEKRNI